MLEGGTCEQNADMFTTGERLDRPW